MNCDIRGRCLGFFFFYIFGKQSDRKSRQKLGAKTIRVPLTGGRNSGTLAIVSCFQVQWQEAGSEVQNSQDPNQAGVPRGSRSPHWHNAPPTAKDLCRLPFSV